MKELSKKLHLYFGLISAVFVFFIALSGTIYVFNDEIIKSANGDAMNVSRAGNRSKITVDSLLKQIKAAGLNPTQFVYHKDEHRSFYTLAHDADERYVQVYQNPYTGNIIAMSRLHAFFNSVEEFHTELYAGAPGRAFIGIITTLFLILSITGIVLWLPKRWNTKTAKHSFTINLKGNKKVINYDLHKILGCYIVIPAIILSVTGMIMAFDPIEIGILKAMKADADYETTIEHLETTDADSTAFLSYDAIVNKLLREQDKIGEVRITLPQNDNAAFVLCETGNNFGMKYTNDYQTMYIDRTSGDKLNLSEQTGQSLALKKGLSQLHTGKMMGLPYKIILFIAGLIMTSLPVTGFIIWWNRRRKRK